MSNTLAALQKLQAVETQLADLRNRIAAKKRRVAQQEQRLARLEQEQQQEQRDLRTRQVEVDRLDLDVKSREVEIAKVRNALNTAKTNKEYAALLTQLNTAKVDSGKIEEKVLELMTQLDEARKKVALAVETRADEERKLAEYRADAEGYEKEHSPRLTELADRRKSVAAAVPAAALGLFERVALKNDGMALAMVVRTNPKREEFACEACNMSITLQQVNSLLSRDEPVVCNTCGHILFLDAHTAGAR